MSEETLREMIAKLLGTDGDLDVSTFKPKGKPPIVEDYEPRWDEIEQRKVLTNTRIGDGTITHAWPATISIESRKKIEDNIREKFQLVFLDGIRAEYERQTRAEFREAFHRKHPDPPPEQFVNVVIRKKK